MAKKQIPKKSADISEWYTRVILEADLVDYGPVKGTMIFKPYGYRIWELVQKAMDGMLKEGGVQNAYFPLFIPMSLLEKEKAHVEGFSPELAVVTHGGGEKLKEPLAVRPTSETVMYYSYAKWIQSWRDLPLLLNQWNNVVRWEKRTYLFMRTSEFLWQEGHTAHATHAESTKFQGWVMDVYEKTFKEHFALYGYRGYKSANERFAGADSTLAYEILMPSGKALQSGTSHDLGQNFAKPFGIKFQDKNGKESHVWQTSWGVSTRSIGGLVLAHGDDNGLRLPPQLAPVQAIILPVLVNDQTAKYAESVKSKLEKAGIRAEVDATDDESIGFRINKWELKGAPLRIEVGDKEIKANELTIARRDNGEKQTIKLEASDKALENLLTQIQTAMLKESEAYAQHETRQAKDYAEFKKIMKEHKGFIKVLWEEDSENEDKIQQDTKATSRCRIEDAKSEGNCFYSGKKTKQQWLFAQAY